MTGPSGRNLNETGRTGKRPLPGKAGALLAILTGLLMVVPPFDAALVNLSYDAIFWWRDDRPADEAVIVYMDEESHERLGQPRHQPWDRAVHGQLIQRLSELGARAIAFDVLFDNPGEAASDERLISAARAHGRVAMAAVVKPVFVEGGLVGWQTRRAFPALGAVTAAGVVAQDIPGSAIRRDFCNPSVTNLPSLGACALLLAGGTLPTKAAERWLNYHGPPGFLPHLKYHEVLASNVTSQVAGLVSNRVVFVGAALDPVGFTGGRMTDDFRTPYWSGQMSPGVEINATSFLNLARHEWLSRLPAAFELGLIALVGLIFGLALGRLKPVTALGAAGLTGTLFAAVAIGVAWHWRVWFPWGVPVLAQLPVAVGASFLTHIRRLWREKRAFEQALALASEGRATTTGFRPLSPTGPGLREAGVSAEIPEFLREPHPREKREGLPPVPDHELIRCIGRGAFGEVWLARDILGSHHAVKVLRLGAFANAGPLQTEFEGLRRFTPISRSHPGLVHVLHVGRDPASACLYYVMELADDEVRDSIDPATYAPRTWARELARRGRLPLDEVLAMGTKLADALEHLHRHQLVHRDIKPANIVFVKGQPKLADAGLVSDVVTGVNGLAFLGTPGRIAPEGAGRPGADVFSLGRVLYEAGFGMAVERFPELPPDMIASGADPGLFELNRILMKACDQDPRRRHASAGELRDALRALWKRRNAGEIPSAWNEAPCAGAPVPSDREP